MMPPRHPEPRVLFLDRRRHFGVFQIVHRLPLLLQILRAFHRFFCPFDVDLLRPFQRRGNCSIDQLRTK